MVPRAGAYTLPYDVVLCGDGRPPADRLGRVAVPTLVVDGGESPPEMRTAAAATAAAVARRYETLPGQDHAVLQNPQALAPLIRSFLGGEGQSRVT